MIYQTMTPKGYTGQHYEASNDEEATAMAEADGETVLDIQEAAYPATAGYDFILVIPDTDT